VRHQHGPGGELQEARQHGAHGGRAHEHRRGDARELGDHRGYPAAAVHQRGQLAEYLPAAHLDRPDLGDGVGSGAATGGLQVHHHERDLPQRSAQLVEGELIEPGGRGHGRTVGIETDGFPGAPNLSVVRPTVRAQPGREPLGHR